MKREERSEFIRRLRGEQAASFRSNNDRRLKEQQRKVDIELADLDPDRCLLLSEIEPNRFASTFAEEVSSALVFANLLGVEVDLDQTLLEWLQKIYVEWYKLKLPLLNPISRSFSPHVVKIKYAYNIRRGERIKVPSAKAALKRFNEQWVLLSPETEYFRPLRDFIPQTPVPAAELPSASPPAATPPMAQGSLERSDQQDGESPTLLYRASITPRAGEE